jgi:hypothetical protein
MSKKIDYTNISAEAFASDLMAFASNEIPPIYKSKSDKIDLYFLMGYLAAGRCFIEVRTPSWKYDDLCETLNWLTPLTDYVPTDEDRGFYIDDTKWSWGMTLRVKAEKLTFNILSPAIDQDTLAKCGAEFKYSDKNPEVINTVVVRNTKFCLYLLRHGFRIGKYNAIDEIKQHVPKLYRKAFMDGVNH